MNLREKIDLFYDKIPIGRWGLIGVGVFAFLGVLICQIGATDLNGCNYNFINHAISELGGVGHTWGWWLFSLCLIIGGFLSIFFIFGLGFYIEGKFARPFAIFGMIIGILSSIFLMGVGIFPWNVNRKMHFIVAGAFFGSALVTSVIVSISIFLQDLEKNKSKIPRWFGLGGFMVTLVVFIFLQQDFGLAIAKYEDITGCREGLEPALFWEWMVLYAISIWMIIASYITRNKTTRAILKK